MATCIDRCVYMDIYAKPRMNESTGNVSQTKPEKGKIETHTYITCVEMVADELVESVLGLRLGVSQAEVAWTNLRGYARRWAFAFRVFRGQQLQSTCAIGNLFELNEAMRNFGGKTKLFPTGSGR